MKKVCRRCGEEKDIENFYVYHRTAGYPDIGQPCGECRKLHGRKYYSYNPIKKSGQNKNHD
jgi:hypothetical protein